MDTFLEKLLEESLSGRVVPRYELPREHETHAVHAQLAAGIRESRSFRMVEVSRKESDERAE